MYKITINRPILFNERMTSEKDDMIKALEKDYKENKELIEKLADI